MRNIFLTGATGLLGSYILKEFLDRDDVVPFVLVRSKDNEPPSERIKKTLRYFYGVDYKVMLKRIKIIEGDVNSKSLGMNKKTRQYLTDNMDEIFHSAAIAEFRIPIKKIREVNLEGTRNIMNFALECRNMGRVKKVNHISTVCVAGNRQGIFYEDELNVGQKFNNTYEQSKFEAEILIKEYNKNGLGITIFRPSILTGDSVSGKTSNFKMLYQPLRFLVAELFESIPANRESQFNLVPVDSAAKAILMISSKEGVEGKTFHISNTTTVSLGQLVDVASIFFGFKKPRFIPPKDYDIQGLTPVQKELIVPYISYLDYNPLFDSTNARKVLMESNYNIPVFDRKLLHKLFKFCIYTRFIKQRTAHVAA